eukprot:SAG11_NODE_6496_length_1302_cov_0.986700_1_plen_114_part_10
MEAQVFALANKLASRAADTAAASPNAAALAADYDEICLIFGEHDTDQSGFLDRDEVSAAAVVAQPPRRPNSAETCSGGCAVFSFRSSVCPSVCLSVRPSVRLSVCVSVCLSVCL